MFDPDSDIPPASVSDDGNYFLDACPRAFSVILNWLRYKKILGKEVQPDDVIPVAEYFGLPELCEKLEAMKKKENNNYPDIIRLNVGGTIFETTRKTLTQKPNATANSPRCSLQDPRYRLHSPRTEPTSLTAVLN